MGNSRSYLPCNNQIGTSAMRNFELGLRAREQASFRNPEIFLAFSGSESKYLTESLATLGCNLQRGVTLRTRLRALSPRS